MKIATVLTSSGEKIVSFDSSFKIGESFEFAQIGGINSGSYALASSDEREGFIWLGEVDESEAEDFLMGSSRIYLNENLRDEFGYSWALAIFTRGSEHLVEMTTGGVTTTYKGKWVLADIV